MLSSRVRTIYYPMINIMFYIIDRVPSLQKILDYENMNSLTLSSSIHYLESAYMSSSIHEYTTLIKDTGVGFFLHSAYHYFIVIVQFIIDIPIC